MEVIQWGSYALDLFKEMDVEEKGWLTKEQGLCFWYSTGLLGWTEEVVTLDNLEDLFAACFKKHKRIVSLMSGDPVSLLHKISSSFSLVDLEEISRHIRGNISS